MALLQATGQDYFWGFVLSYLFLFLPLFVFLAYWLFLEPARELATAASFIVDGKGTHRHTNECAGKSER